MNTGKMRNERTDEARTRGAEESCPPACPACGGHLVEQRGKLISRGAGESAKAAARGAKVEAAIMIDAEKSVDQTAAATITSRAGLTEALGRLDPADPRYATEAVERILAAARGLGASDVHFQPGADGLELTWRIDGVLQPVATLPAQVAPNVVARLKVLAELLDLPDRRPPGRADSGGARRGRDAGQHVPDALRREGRGPDVRGAGPVPAARRPRAAGDGRGGAGAHARETSGAIVLSGPAGSGKTTTIYACLRELAARSRGERSLATLEDPIEAVVPGVAQAQVNPAAGLTLESGLKSLLRQDPEVIAIGEIRDRATAEIALQAALTGHLILTTFHAGSACEVIGRFLDMGIEPYVVRSGLRAVVAQRLVRRLCACAGPPTQPRRLPRPAGQPRQAAARLRRLPRHRLPRPDRPRRDAPARDRRARARPSSPAATSASSSRSPSPPA